MKLQTMHDPKSRAKAKATWVMPDDSIFCIEHHDGHLNIQLSEPRAVNSIALINLSKWHYVKGTRADWHKMVKNPEAVYAQYYLL